MSLTWCMGSQMAGGGASWPQFHPGIRGFLSLPQNTFLRLKSSTVWLESVGASSTTRLTSCVSFTPVGHRDLASMPSLPPPAPAHTRQLPAPLSLPRAVIPFSLCPPGHFGHPVPPRVSLSS